MSKPFLIIQLRPEDETADNEFESITYYGGMEKSEVIRIRAEKSGLPSIDLDRYAAIIVGGSPFNVSDRRDDKREEQKRVESDFYKLFDRLV